jgi:hypothetical protein
MIRILILLAVLMSALSGCSISADTAAAERAVSKFHEQLDASRFNEIYEGSSEDLRKATTHQDMVALLEDVHRKLGPTKSSKEQTWHVNFHTSGDFVTLKYKTAYANGDMDEEFIYRMRDKTPLLAGYHFKSSAPVNK